MEPLLSNTTAAEAARETERFFRALLVAIPDAILISDDRGTIRIASAAAESLFGYARGEMSCQSLEQFIPDLRLKAQRMDGHREFQGMRKDRSTFPAEVSLSTFDAEARPMITVHVRDITEFKKTQDDQRQLLAIIRSSDDAIISKDLNGMITSWNRGAEQIFGYSPEEAIGKPITILFPENKAEVEHTIEQRVLKEGGPIQRYETVRRRKNGSLVEVSVTISPIRDEDGTIIGASKFAHDITDRKRAETGLLELNRTLEQRVAERTDELLRSEERFHRAMDLLVEGVQIIGYDWRYLYVNDSLVGHSTYTREDLLGNTMMEKYPGIEHTQVFAVLRECMKDRTARHMENDFTFPDGSIGAFYLRRQPVAEGHFILSTEISERRRAELEMAAQREQLARQNKELEQFAFIASHDLQEPLRMVTSYVQLLQRRYTGNLDADADEFIGFAVDGTIRMKRLIDDLLAYSRSGKPLALENIDMNGIMAHVRANLASAINEYGAVLLHGNLPTVKAAETEMLQLMQNLVGNAVKFRRDGVRPEVHVSGNKEASHWHFEVRDNGIGIEEQYRAQVFMPFKRLQDRAKYPGSGIGLAVAQKIVERFGGRIWFDSVPGEGTIFHFTIKHQPS